MLILSSFTGAKCGFNDVTFVISLDGIESLRVTRCIIVTPGISGLRSHYVSRSYTCDQSLPLAINDNFRISKLIYLFKN